MFQIFEFRPLPRTGAAAKRLAQEAAISRERHEVEHAFAAHGTPPGLPAGGGAGGATAFAMHFIFLQKKEARLQFGSKEV